MSMRQIEAVVDNCIYLPWLINIIEGVSEDDGNEYFEYLSHEEKYKNWIKPFNEPTRYVGERELSKANSTLDFLSLFLCGQSSTPTK